MNESLSNALYGEYVLSFAAPESQETPAKRVKRSGENESEEICSTCDYLFIYQQVKGKISQHGFCVEKFMLEWKRFGHLLCSVCLDVMSISGGIKKGSKNCIDSIL